MITPLPCQKPLRTWFRQRAFALVVIMIFMALMVVTLLALLTHTETERQAASVASEGGRARRISDTAVAIALAQLRSGTEPQSASTAPKVWTSQPGAIRVHQQNGDLETVYKLYSAASLTATSEADLNADLPPADWQNRTAEFVDLNAPTVKEGDLHFPILDPRAMIASENGLQPVEGFEFKTDDSPPGTVATAGAPNSMRLPMPVRWLYMLQDGTLGTLAADGRFVAYGPPGQTGSTPTPIVPSRKNPIVARMAFWVDDESCKINVNTAAEGSFWDTPRADTTQERELAVNQPTRLEYHRQPGHPAGVCLSSFLLPGQRFHPTGFNSRMDQMDLDTVQELWRLGRLWVADEEQGTSRGGTMAPTLLASASAAPQPRTRHSRYAAVGDLVFDDPSPATAKKWSGNNAGAPTSRSTQTFFSQQPDALKRMRSAEGFLTAHSSAPEVTLYGTPRITLWPVHQSTPAPGSPGDAESEFKKYTAYDRTAVLASTLKDSRYLIQRSEPGNGINDFDTHGGGQNQKLLNYLRALTDRPVPGWTRGSTDTFAAKYGADPITGDRESILLSMMDYVRSTNFADGQLPPNTQFSILCPGPGQEYHGFGQVSPLQPRVVGENVAEADHVRGQGRVMTVSEVALVITCRAEVDQEGTVQGDVSDENEEHLKNPGDREIEVALLVEGFLPTQGWTDYRPFTSIALVGGAPKARPNSTDPLPQLKLNGQLLVPPSSGKVIEAEDSVPAGWRGWGGTLGVRGLSRGLLRFRPLVFKATGEHPLEPQPLVFEGASSDGNQLKLAMYDTPSGAATVTASEAELLQVIPLRLPDLRAEPDAELPGLVLPRLPTGTGGRYGLTDRMKNSVKGNPLLSQEDIVQSLVPAHADYRMMSARRWVESRNGNIIRPLFVAHPRWNMQPQAHCLRDPFLYAPGTGPSYSGGHFIPGLDVPAGVRPDFPPGFGLPVRAFQGSGWSMLSPKSASDALRLDGGARGEAWPDATGDFDNGVGNCPDGAYTARPDDGNWAATIKSGLPYFDPDAFSQVGKSVPPVTGAGFSAQRMIPSPVAFGGLPTGVRTQVPWQTLLFRPQADHYGASNPPDHLLLDLFWSPVLEPEPVSRPFETDGKINLNHQLIPFRHIHRATALHAAMKAETMMAIPDSTATTYKNDTAEATLNFRHYIDAEATVKVWKERVFDQGRVFLAPGQICEHPLIPEGLESSQAAVDNFWANHRLTGDNTKERPYAHLYSRLTTRSNAFRVHFVVETLKKARSTAPDRIDPAKDKVTSRSQGSRLLMRHLDYRRSDLPNYLEDTNPQPLDAFYDWQIAN